MKDEAALSNLASVDEPGEAGEEGLERVEQAGDHPDGRRLPDEPMGLDAMKMYLREIRNIPLLTEEQERELGRMIRGGDEEARKKMIEANLRLVVAIGRRYINRSLPFADIVEEGNLGLIRAAEKFDPEKGCRFSTYASWWVRQAIERALSRHMRIIRLPFRLSDRLFAYIRSVRQLTQRLSREPSDAEVAEAMGLAVGKVRALEEAKNDALSLDEYLGSAQEESLGSRIEDRTMPSPLEAWERQLRRKHVKECLAVLSESERQVLETRYGLGDGEQMSAAGTGRSLGMTTEGVRQIETRSKKKLRAFFAKRRLDAEGLLAETPS